MSSLSGGTEDGCTFRFFTVDIDIMQKLGLKEKRKVKKRGEREERKEKWDAGGTSGSGKGSKGRN